MTRYFEYNDNKSSRFWEISLNGNLVITSYGKTGTQGKESTRSFASEPAAQKEADKQIREKTGKGYVETSHPDNPVKPDKPVRSSKTSPFRIMTAQDLFARYGDRISDRFRQYYDADAGLNALVYAGEAFIDGMLDITGQCFSNFKDMIAPPVPGNMENSPVGAVVVIGNLDITGNLVNKDARNPFLYVSGNVKARSLVCGNSIMIVGENVNIDEATLCYGANGLLEVGGTLTTAWLDKGDHPFSIGGTRVMFRKDIDTMRRSDMFRSNILGYDDALRTLFTGGSVFAASDNDTDDNDYDCWMEQVKKNGKKLKNVPGSLVDDGMCLAALINTSDAIKYVPGRIFTEPFLLKLVGENPRLSCCIPKQYYTPRVAEAIVAGEGRYLSEIPVSLITREICYTAAQNGTSIQYIPAQFLDEDLLAVILRHNPSEIENLPRRFFSLRLFVEAAMHGHFLLPYGKRFYEFYESIGIPVEQISIAVARKGFEYFDRLPGYAVTAGVYSEAEKLFAPGPGADRWEDSKNRHGTRFYQYIWDIKPEKLEQIERNPEHEIRLGVKDYNKDYLFTQYIWNVFWTRELFEASVRYIYTGNEQAGYVRYIPDQWFTEDIMWTILRCSCHNYHYLPKQALNRRLCIYVVADHGGRIDSIPKELIDEGVALVAVSECMTEFGRSDGSGFYLDHVPYQFRTPAVCKAALDDDDRAIPHVPAPVMKLLNNGKVK